LAPQTPKRFRSVLLRWYSKNGRDLPWRRTRDPYPILVSEFMLQQTQVATVLPYYRNWLRRFPNFNTLAGTSETEVLHAWQGLGYYARARNLQRTAKLVINRHDGKFPRSIEQMRALPGIGKYTAHAVATFAFDQAAPIVEANTARVLSRVFNLRTPIDSAAGQNKLWQHAASLVPQGSSSVYNSALLDLGALVCLPRNPKCGSCPIQKLCRAKNPDSLPRKKPRAAMKQLIENHRFIRQREKLLLVQSRNRWRGMWILPPLQSAKHNGAIYSAVFPFTNHRVTLKVFRTYRHKIENESARWFSKRALMSIPIPSPHRRAIEQLTAKV
jgi:A/G-specific adenine glycosylase